MTTSVCILSGLDPSGGAGFIADAQVVSRVGGRPCGLITAATVQDTLGVRSVHPLPAEVVQEQLRALLSDVEVRAVKIGMLGNAELAGVIGDALHLTAAPVVWDPVVRPTAGSAALYDGGLAEAFAKLAPHLAVITPNLDEASRLCGRPIETLDHMRSAAAALASEAGCAVLITGGHVRHASRRAVDVLAVDGTVSEFSHERIETTGAVHGTGCALSSALAAHLALGASIPEAVERAKALVTESLRHPIRAGRGASSVV